MCIVYTCMDYVQWISNWKLNKFYFHSYHSFISCLFLLLCFCYLLFSRIFLLVLLLLCGWYIKIYTEYIYIYRCLCWFMYLHKEESAIKASVQFMLIVYSQWCCVVDENLRSNNKKRTTKTRQTAFFSSSAFFWRCCSQSLFAVYTFV